MGAAHTPTDIAKRLRSYRNPLTPEPLNFGPDTCRAVETPPYREYGSQDARRQRGSQNHKNPITTPFGPPGRYALSVTLPDLSQPSTVALPGIIGLSGTAPTAGYFRKSTTSNARPVIPKRPRHGDLKSGRLRLNVDVKKDRASVSGSKRATYQQIPS